MKLTDQKEIDMTKSGCGRRSEKKDKENLVKLILFSTTLACLLEKTVTFTGDTDLECCRWRPRCAGSVGGSESRPPWSHYRSLSQRTPCSRQSDFEGRPRPFQAAHSTHPNATVFPEYEILLWCQGGGTEAFWGQGSHLGLEFHIYKGRADPLRPPGGSVHAPWPRHFAS